MRMRKKLLALGAAAMVAGATIVGISMSGAARRPPPCRPPRRRSNTSSFSSRRTSRSITTSVPTRTPSTAPGNRPSPRLRGRRRSTAWATALLTENPNLTQPGAPRSRPKPLTCDQNHSYAPEQEAEDNGKMDMFVQKTDRRRLQPDNGKKQIQLRPPRDRHGLLRRQHRHRALELRPALRTERQLLQQPVRSLDPWCDQPDQRRHRRRVVGRTTAQRHRRRAAGRRRTALRPVRQRLHGAGKRDRQRRNRSNCRAARPPK